LGYTVGALKQKINDIFPEIEKNGILIGLVFNEDKNAYFINFRKGRTVFASHLQKNEADACMEGSKFVFLGSQTGRWMKNFVAIQTQTADILAAQTTQQDQQPVIDLYRGSFSRKEEQWATQL